MIKVSITKEQQKELVQFRSVASSKNSEKALMVLLSSEGEKVSQIAKALKRNPHTVRDWLKRYNADGLKGLSRKYSPGRPDEKRAKLKVHIQKLLMILLLHMATKIMSGQCHSLCMTQH